MKKRLLTLSLFILLTFCLVGLYFCDYLPIFILTYVFIFLITAFSTLFSSTKLLSKILLIAIYATIMTLQILYTVLVTFGYSSVNEIYNILKLSSAIIVYAPFIVKNIYLSQNQKKKILKCLLIQIQMPFHIRN